MKLWLDDWRDPKEWLPSMPWFRGRSDVDDWTWVLTAQDAIAALEAGGIDEVSLDHDLGDEEVVGTGYQVACWIEERTALDDSYDPPVLHVHSGNGPAADRMIFAVRSIEGMVARRSSP